MVSNHVVNEVFKCFTGDIAANAFRLRIRKLLREMGLERMSGSAAISAYLQRADEDLAHAATRQDQHRLSMLGSAFSQLRDSGRTQAKMELLSGALSCFYTLSTIPEQGFTVSFSHKEIRALAFLGLAAVYYQLEDSDELVAEKLAFAVYEDHRTAAMFLDPNYMAQFETIFNPAQNDSRFGVNGGLAIDHEHGLIWTRFALGQHWAQEKIQGRLIRYTWLEAFAAIEAFNRQGGYEGHTDWRLPGITELKALVDAKEGNEKKGIHFINNRVFPTNYELFWSATPGTYNENVAWMVDFTNGSAFYGNINFGYAVRLVRSA